MHRFGIVLLALVVLVISQSGAGQGHAGEFTGSVVGPKKTALSGARIMIRHQQSGAVVSVVAGAHGIYRAPGLRAGAYELRAELEGFEPTAISSAVILEGETKVVDIVLAVATIKEIVTVIGPAPHDSLEAAQARETSARDVGEALAETVGLWKLRKGGIATDVVLRGFQSKDLNVLIDGQRIYGACPNHMDPPAFHADFAEVDRIEVGKGPFDVKNQGSLGGVINIVTRKPEHGFHASADMATGSFGFINPSATASYGAARFSVLGGYSYRRSKPYTDGAEKRFTEYANYRTDLLNSDSFRIGTAWAKISATPAPNHMVQLSYTRQEADHILYPYLLMDAIYDNADRVNIAYQVDRGSGLVKSLRFHAYLTQVHHWMTDLYRVSSVGMMRDYSMGTMARTRAFGGRFEAELRALTMGVEAFRREWDTTTFLAPSGYQTQHSIPDVGTDALGVYAEYHKSINDRLKLDLGVRIDAARSNLNQSKANTGLYYAYNSTRSTSATDAFPSGNLRLTYTSSHGFQFSWGVGHTSRIPEPQERYFALRRTGSDWVGNPGLTPSRNTGVDGAVSFRRHGLFMGSNFYFNRVQDFITINRQAKLNSVAGIMNSFARSYQNIDASLYGGEMQVAYTLTQRIFLSSDLSYVRGSQDPDPARGIYSKHLPEIPPLSSRTTVRYDTGKLAAEIEGLFVSAQRRVDTDLREEPTAGYGVANIKLGATLNRFAARFALNNLLNRRFYEHLSYQRDPFRSGVRVSEPGRNFHVNLSYRF